MNRGNSIKLRVSNAIVYLLFIAIFKQYFMPQALQQGIKCLCLFLVMLFLVTNAKIKWLLNNSLFFAGCVVLSSVVNFVSLNQNDFKTMLNGLLYAITFYLIYTTIEYFSKTGKFYLLINCLYRITFIYCVISFICVFFPVSHERGILDIYALGNKFTTSYYFVLLISLYCIRNFNEINKNLTCKIKLIMIVVISMIYSIISDCMTTAFMILICIVVFFAMKKTRYKLLDEKILLLSVLFGVAFPFLMVQLIENESVRHFIYVTLDRQRSFGGRINIFSFYFLNIMKENWLFGYGYSSDVFFEATGGSYGNAQNGLLQHIYASGLFGCISLVQFMVHSFKKSSGGKECIFGALIVYAMILGGLVEVTYGYFLFVGISLVRWMPENYISARRQLQ